MGFGFVQRSLCGMLKGVVAAQLCHLCSTKQSCHKEGFMTRTGVSVAQVAESKFLNNKLVEVVGFMENIAGTGCC